MADFCLSAQRAHVFCAQVLAAVGVGGDEAALCAELLVDASLRGVDSHGILSLAIYVERLRSGQIRPGMDLKVLSEAKATLLCDGQHGLGPVLACRAVDRAVEKAGDSGLAAVSLVNGNYVGALAPYVQRAAARGFIGVCMANSTPRVAPHGGAAGLHGTNPIAYAVPIEGEEPLLFDAATGHSAARVAAAQEEGQSLPEGVLVNDQGRATVDPQDLDGGALLPVGGALGYGLGLLVDVLCGGLSGGPCGPDVPPVGDLAGPYGCGFFVLAIDPDYFGGREVLAARCAFLVRSARQTRPAAQEERVRVPGDRAREEQHARQIRGIPLARGRWEAVLQRLRACGLAVDDWAWERLA